MYGLFSTAWIRALFELDQWGCRCCSCACWLTWKGCSTLNGTEPLIICLYQLQFLIKKSTVKGAFVMALGGYSSPKLKSIYFCLLHVIYSTPELYFWEISDGASGPEFHKMFKITDLVQFNFPVSISPLYVLICKVCWPCTLCPDLETWRVEGWKSQHVHIVRLQIYEPPQLQRSAKYLRLLVYIVLFLLWWNDMREGKAACKGVSLGDILGNTLRSNYIVCNMLIGHLHSSGTGSPTLDFKVMT